MRSGGGTRVVKSHPGMGKRIEADVIWLMGLSGAGKSTLAKMLVERLAAAGRRVELIDGDLTRDFFEDRGDYSRENRIANVKRIAFAAMLLARQGVTVVVSNASPFEETRRFIRSKIPGYREIYLSASVEDCAKRDDKGLYARAKTGALKEMVGLDLPFEVPESPDQIGRAHV